MGQYDESSGADPAQVVTLRPGVAAEDVRRFFGKFSHQCSDYCRGHGLPTVLYLGGQASIYCHQGCRKPVATLLGGRVYFLDAHALALGVVERFEEYQSSITL